MVKNNDFSMKNDPIYRSANDVYSLLLISLILSPLTLPLALGIILYRLPQSRGSFLRSHFLYALGNILQYPVVVLAVVLAWRWVAAQAFFTAQGNIFPPLLLYPALVILPVAWWIWRFVQGYRLLKAGKGIAEPFFWGKVREAA